MADLKVVKAKPPETMTIFFPSIRFQGKEFPRGPRTPILRPFSELCSSSVTVPVRFTVKRRDPFSVGDEAMPNGDSPLPNIETSANCPGA